MIKIDSLFHPEHALLIVHMLKTLYSEERRLNSYCPCVEEIDFCFSKDPILFGTSSVVYKENLWKHLTLKCDKVFNKSATLLDSVCHSQWNCRTVFPHQYFTALFWRSIISSVLQYCMIYHSTLNSEIPFPASAILFLALRQILLWILCIQSLLMLWFWYHCHVILLLMSYIW